MPALTPHTKVRMTRSTLTTFLALALSACGRDAAVQDEAARQATADSARIRATADSVRQAATADSLQRAQRQASLVDSLSRQIGFDYGRAAIRAAGRSILDLKVEILRANPSVRIQVAGHTDIRSSDRFNQALGMRRAEAVKLYLTRAGIAADRIDVVSYGKTQPVDTGTSRAAHARNRRAEFAVVAGGPASRR